MTPSTPPDSVANLVELLRWRAEVSAPEQGFQFLAGGSDDSEALSFADLDRRARAIGARLSRHIDPGERVLLLYPPSLDYIEAFFGALYAGAIAVPAYPPNPRRLERTLPRLLSVIDDSGADVALATSTIAGMASGLAGQSETLAQLDWIATDDIDDHVADDWSADGLDSDTVAFLQYTSGSTGAPKGVVLDHGTLLRNEHFIQQAFGSKSDDVGVNWLPLYHDMGLIGAVIQPVFCGCESILMSPLDFLKNPVRWLEAIDEYGGTMSTAPNFGYDLAVRKTPEDVRDELDLSTWNVACNGAEPIRPQTMQRFADYFGPAGFDESAFMPAYGLAEVGLIVSATPRADRPTTLAADGKEHVSCGPPLGDFELAIVDPDTQRLVDDGDVGEIWLRGGSVARGYWQRDDVNEEIFDAHLQCGDGPFLRTGDLGIFDGDTVAITGRLKDLIVIRGANHYPQDIEATVENVSDAIRPGCGAAFSVTEQDSGEQLVVVQEVNPNSVDDPAQLLERIERAITEAHQLVPRDVVLIEPRTIRKTSSGKIQRFATKECYENGELQVVERRDTSTPDEPRRANERGEGPTRSDLQRWLVERVADEAGLDRHEIALDAPFSSYGIDSAQAVGIVGELERRLGIEIPATALYDFPTIADLAAHLDGTNDDDSDADQVDEARSRPAISTDSPGDDGDAVAIVGMACRFPGADGIDALFDLLEGGDEAIDTVDSSRWQPDTFTDPDIAGFDTMATDRAGFVDDIDGFDARFFGISPREARAMDPQQRMIMETSWHAIEDAGWTRKQLRNSRTGVFVGQSGSDFARLYDGAPVRAGSGMAPSITANRLSYWLDLRGPSTAIDTACSSSLVAVDQALLNLRANRCNQAIVGGVNAILAPDMSVAFSRARMLSEEGRSRVFDADADGYVRGEGAGVVVLKRLADARRDGDRIRAVIRGSAVNQDGRTNGLTAPNGAAQRRVIRAALADAGVEPQSIGALEAHGTGTDLGDAIEVKSLHAVFDEPPRTGDRRPLGSIKAQIGHLEGGAGIAGLIKAALMVERNAIFPQPNFETPNPACQFDDGTLVVPQQQRRWRDGDAGSDTPRRAGISAFGFGGTNAHVIIEEPPEQSASSGEPEASDGPSAGLVGIAAADADRLRAYAEALADDDHLWSQSPSARDLGYSLARSRDEDPVRIGFTGSDTAAVRAELRRIAAASEGELDDRIETAQRGGFGLFFGPRQPGAAVAVRRLIDTVPAIRRHFDDAADAFGAAGLAAPRDVIDGTADDTEHIEALEFCVQYALARLFQQWGFEPAATGGVGIGAYSRDVISGDIGLGDAARRIVDADEAIAERQSGIDELLDADVEFGLHIGAAASISEQLDVKWIDASAPDDNPLGPLDAAARLWVAGIDGMHRAANAGGRYVKLPATPFDRRPYWPNDDELRTFTPGD